MPKVSTFDAAGAPAGQVDLPEAIFGLRPHRPVLHQAVVAELANRRAGTHATKTRGDVRGGGRKPWRQKGTGRARQGSRRSPIWVGGGITFGPQPRSYRQNPPRRERVVALRTALSAQAQVGRLIIIDPEPSDQLRTKAAAAYLQAVGATTPAVILVDDGERALSRALANIDGVRVLWARRLGVRHLLAPRTVVITKRALATLQEALGS
jgi:large subunit ribosomal protein L4